MTESLESRLSRIRFSASRVGADRIHHINEEDVRVVLSRLPLDLWHRLRAVHFNDRSRAYILGYVTQASTEISICALPPHVSLTGALVKDEKPQHFGAQRGQQWPLEAVRRFLLYGAFLHELGHLQLINPNGRSERLKFAREKLAEEFAILWRKRLWSVHFPHPDPVHNRPEIEVLIH